MSGKSGIFRQGGEELLLSGRREVARLGFFYLWQSAEDFAGVYHYGVADGEGGGKVFI